MYMKKNIWYLRGKWKLIMKRSKEPLKNMLDIIAICIVLHNLFIIKNERIEDEWIVEQEKKIS